MCLCQFNFRQCFGTTGSPSSRILSAVLS
jgi:hypothetical protein